MWRLSTEKKAALWARRPLLDCRSSTLKASLTSNGPLKHPKNLLQTDSDVWSGLWPQWNILNKKRKSSRSTKNAWEVRIPYILYPCRSLLEFFDQSFAKSSLGSCGTLALSLWQHIPSWSFSLFLSTQSSTERTPGEAQSPALAPTQLKSGLSEGREGSVPPEREREQISAVAREQRQLWQHHPWPPTTTPAPELLRAQGRSGDWKPEVGCDRRGAEWQFPGAVWLCNYHISDVHWHPSPPRISGSKDSDDPICERHSTWQLPAQPVLFFLLIPGIKQPASSYLIVVTIYLRNVWNGGWDVAGFSVHSPFPKPSQWKTVLFLHCPDIQLPSMGHAFLWQEADKKFVHRCMKWK